LVNIAEEIALHKRVIVHREDKDFLLRIRKGEFKNEELMKMVEEKKGLKTYIVNLIYQKHRLSNTPVLKTDKSVS